jgi:Bardet-Biedl syndrome 2 protein
LSDIDGDNSLELIVGSEDNYIRIFKNEEILYEISEASPTKCLCSMSKSRFAFGLENGMVGVYNKKARKWRAKSQIKPIALV